MSEHVTEYDDLDILYNDLSRAYNTLRREGADQAATHIYSAITALDAHIREKERDEMTGIEMLKDLLPKW
jgi:hypothetical protein